MSTEFTTVPKVSYQKVLQAKCVQVQTPQRIVYNSPHVLLHKDGVYIFVRECEDGSAEFERWGQNAVIPMLTDLELELGVQIFDEYGLNLQESGG